MEGVEERLKALENKVDNLIKEIKGLRKEKREVSLFKLPLKGKQEKSLHEYLTGEKPGTKKIVSRSVIGCSVGGIITTTVYANGHTNHECSNNWCDYRLNRNCPTHYLEMYK